MWIFGRAGPSGFSGSSTAEQVTQGVDGTGLTAIVTGASNGLGIETARVLALRGVHVVMGVRNVKAGEKVKEQILQKIPNSKIDVMEIDLNSLASVRKFASEYISSCLPLNILINNAGIMAPPFTLSRDNIEQQFAVNHLGPFHLTNLLLETMKSTARESQKEGRIVNLSSVLHKSGYKEGILFDKINDESSYDGNAAYGQSKLCNLLNTNELARHLKVLGEDPMAHLNFQEGQSTSRPPLLFGSENFNFWKFRMKIFLKRDPCELWVVENGPVIPRHYDGKPKNLIEMDSNELYMVSYNSKAMNTLLSGMVQSEIDKVSSCTTAKEIRDTIIMSHEGTTKVKEVKLSMLMHE